MSCTNCFNGCTETVSDQCIRYTGNDVPTLGIQHGDTLLSVENSLTTFLASTLTGAGIKPDIPIENFCSLVKNYLPTCTSCTGFTLNDVLIAVIHAACNLQEQVDAIDATLLVLNSDYTLPVDCLAGVTNSSDTHAIVQAILTKLCSVDSDLTSLTAELHTLYSSNGTELNAQIAAYLASIAPSTLVSNKMIPYTAIPFYPTPAFLAGKFDGTGAGIIGSPWEKIYLCNGQNFTPDLRGNVLIGANSMGTGAYSTSNTDTNPPYSNPYYNQGTSAGTNTVTLGLGQIPSHNHVNSTAIDTGHIHNIFANVNYGTGTSGVKSGSDFFIQGGTHNSDSSTANINLTIAQAGGNQAHSNIQPVLGVLYIMYIP